MEYLTHPRHGATHAVDPGEVERLEKAGWKVTKEPTGAEVMAAKRKIIADRLRAELAAVEGEAPAVIPAAITEAPKRRGGRPKKVAA